MKHWNREWLQNLVAEIEEPLYTGTILGDSPKDHICTQDLLRDGDEREPDINNMALKLKEFMGARVIVERLPEALNTGCLSVVGHKGVRGTLIYDGCKQAHILLIDMVIQ